MSAPGQSPQNKEGHDVKITEHDGVAIVTIDGRRMDHVIGYQVNRNPGTPQAFLTVHLLIKKLNASDILLASPGAVGH